MTFIEWFEFGLWFFGFSIGFIFGLIMGLIKEIRDRKRIEKWVINPYVVFGFALILVSLSGN